MATYRELKAQAQKILDEAEKKRVEEMGQALDSIVATLREFDISTAELLAYLRQKGIPVSSASSVAAGTGGKRKAGSSVKPKYRNPETGATWTGRGRSPAWITEAESKGQSRDVFLIENS